MFEKSLQDLVKGLRAIKGDATGYIAKCIAEIRDELKSRDILIKTQALQKLCYLNMLGHDMSWAAFHVIEVMSQERFGLKRIGFGAASQSFTPATDVIVLCTALLKKEFSARSQYEIGLAINCLSNIATEDLSRDLLGDVVTMLTSSRPYIRKKATLLLFKLYLRYPQGLRLTFDNLKRRLTDDSPSVVSCAVNVVCELARKKPSNYLSLAPDLFSLLTTSTNNWMLIKVAKLMSALVQEEPRLARKLLEPLANIVQTTPAKSLMYECVSTLTYALQHTKKADGSDAKNAPAVVRLCTDKLREMVREPDQNLKYLGLTGLMNLMLSNPRVVAEHRELVLLCLVDEDVTIRLRALELITGMVTRRNLPDIVARLSELLEGAEGHWRDELIAKVIFMCSRDKFAYVADFNWYVGVLARLATIPGGTKHAATVAGQLLDVAVRVEEVRPFAVQTLLPMLADANLAAAARTAAGSTGGAAGAIASTGGVVDAAAPAAAAGAEGAAAADSGAGVPGAAALSIAGAGANLGAGHALLAAAWIVGEYASIIPAPMHGPVLDALLQPGTLTLPAAVQSVYIQCAIKLLTVAAQHAAAGLPPLRAPGSSPTASPAVAAATAEFSKLAGSVVERLHPFAVSVHVEVQERACLAQQLLATLGVPFTPLPTPANLAAAKAKADDDLMSLASAPAAPAAAGAASGGLKSPGFGGAGGFAPAPLEADVRVLEGVLTSLFAEPLRPVNPKAQKRVAVPEGLDLDAWIRPEEQRASAAEAEEEAAGSRGGKGGAFAGRAFKYESISFEDSYGVTEEEEYAATASAAAAAGGSGRKGRKGGAAEGDEDDDAWLTDLARKNRKRDAELWGDNSGKGGKKGGEPVLAAADRLGRAGATGGRSDPFYLKSDSSRGRTGAGSAAERDLDVDSIPIRKLEVGPRNSLLDISIFGDFAKKGAAAGKKGEEAGAAAGKRKGKKGRRGGADEEEEEAPAGGRGRTGTAYRIAEDEDMPEGAGAGTDSSDAEGEGGRGKKGKGGKGGKAGDALADIDLSTPLRDDEVLHAYAHRTAGGKAGAAGKGRGRARVLGGGGAAAGEAAEAPAAAAAAEGKPKKSSKKKAAAGAEAEAEGKKAGGKAKKGSKKAAAAAEAEAAAASAAPAPAPAARLSLAGSAPAGPRVLQGDEYAAAEPHVNPLAQDKVVKLTYTAAAQPSAGAAAAGAGAASPAAAAPAGGAVVTVVLRVDPRSVKKTVDWVDLTLPEGCPVTLKRGGLPAGAAPGSVRLASALKERLKGKNRSQRTTLSFIVPDATVSHTVAASISYQVTGAAEPVTVAAPLQLRSTSLLLPTHMEAESYRNLMVSDGAAFTHALVSVPRPAGADSKVTADDVLNMVCGVLRSFAVARSPKHAILYARTPAGQHVTALLKQDEAGSCVNVTVKSVVPGHAAVLVADIAEACKAALAGKDEE